MRGSVDERNRKSIIPWSIILAVFWVVTSFIYSAPEYAKGRTVLLCAFAICLITLMCALFPIKRHKWLLLPTMYLLELSVLGTSIGLAFVQPDQRAATMIAFALMTPVFYIDRTIVIIALEAATFIVYVVFGKGIISPDVYSWGWLTLAFFPLRVFSADI